MHPTILDPNNDGPILNRSDEGYVDPSDTWIWGIADRQIPLMGAPIPSLRTFTSVFEAPDSSNDNEWDQQREIQPRERFYVHHRALQTSEEDLQSEDWVIPDATRRYDLEERGYERENDERPNDSDDNMSIDASYAQAPSNESESSELQHRDTGGAQGAIIDSNDDSLNWSACQALG